MTTFKELIANLIIVGVTYVVGMSILKKLFSEPRGKDALRKSLRKELKKFGYSAAQADQIIANKEKEIIENELLNDYNLPKA